MVAVLLDLKVGVSVEGGGGGGGGGRLERASHGYPTPVYEP